MRKHLFAISLFTVIFLHPDVALAQQYEVSPVRFNSYLNDDFAPVVWKEGLVFMSNRQTNSVISYSNKGERPYTIFFTSKRGSVGWERPTPFLRELITSGNDGPVTFSRDGTIIYFARNNNVKGSLRNISDTTIKIGIYSAGITDSTITGIRIFEHNDLRHNYTTPSLSPDDSRLFFCSDKPGGYGGMDLYYCDWRGDGWGEPENMGPLVNTVGNETFPYAVNNRLLLFSSDKPGGLGGKDIYYTVEGAEEWQSPLALKAPINSEADDFGVSVDSTFSSGYFSSDRRRSDDIFSFRIKPITFPKCEETVRIRFCFTFYDEKHNKQDTFPAIYKWDYGDGNHGEGFEVQHCYEQPGIYFVSLTIYNPYSGEPLSEKAMYNLDLRTPDQAYINIAPLDIVGQAVVLEAITDDLLSVSPVEYYWNTGTGFTPGGRSEIHTFQNSGDHSVELGIVGYNNSTGSDEKVCVSRNIRIYETDGEEIPGIVPADMELTDGKSDSTKSLDFRIKLLLMDDLSEKEKESIGEELAGLGEKIISYSDGKITPASETMLQQLSSSVAREKDMRIELELIPFADRENDFTMRELERFFALIEFFLIKRFIVTEVYQSTFDDSGSYLNNDSEGSQEEGLIKIRILKM